MLTPTTLLGLACLISSASNQDQAQLIQRLTKEEAILVYQTIESGACLPKNFEALLQENQGRVHLTGSTTILPSKECM